MGNNFSHYANREEERGSQRPFRLRDRVKWYRYPPNVRVDPPLPSTSHTPEPQPSTSREHAQDVYVDQPGPCTSVGLQPPAFQEPGDGIDLLEDVHIWNLAKSVTSKQQLRELGLNILKLPANTVESSLFSETEIQNAANKVLQTWCQTQKNRQEAYKNLYTALWNNTWRLLAGQLKQLVKGPADSSASETQTL